MKPLHSKTVIQLSTLKKKSVFYSKKYRKSLRNWFKVRNNRHKLRYTILIGLIILFMAVMIGQAYSKQHADKKYQKTYNSLQSLAKDLQNVQKQKAVTDTELKQKADHEADLQRQIDDLNKQLQSKRDQQQTIAEQLINTVTLIKPVSAAPVSGCGDNFYANFIYMHESGCSLYNPNSSSGACGLGQAYPCSKLMNVCPGMDYACENAFFNAYAAKYGGWAGAYAFWLANSWW